MFRKIILLFHYINVVCSSISQKQHEVQFLLFGTRQFRQGIVKLLRININFLLSAIISILIVWVYMTAKQFTYDKEFIKCIYQTNTMNLYVCIAIIYLCIMRYVNTWRFQKYIRDKVYNIRFFYLLKVFRS